MGNHWDAVLGQELPDTPAGHSTVKVQ